MRNCVLKKMVCFVESLATTTALVVVVDSKMTNDDGTAWWKGSCDYIVAHVLQAGAGKRLADTVKWQQRLGDLPLQYECLDFNTLASGELHAKVNRHMPRPADVLLVCFNVWPRHQLINASST